MNPGPDPVCTNNEVGTNMPYFLHMPLKQYISSWFEIIFILNHSSSFMGSVGSISGVIYFYLKCQSLPF